MIIIIIFLDKITVVRISIGLLKPTRNALLTLDIPLDHLRLGCLLLLRRSILLLILICNCWLLLWLVAHWLWLYWCVRWISRRICRMVLIVWILRKRFLCLRRVSYIWIILALEIRWLELIWFERIRSVVVFIWRVISLSIHSRRQWVLLTNSRRWRRMLDIIVVWNEWLVWAIDRLRFFQDRPLHAWIV